MSWRTVSFAMAGLIAVLCVGLAPPARAQSPEVGEAVVVGRGGREPAGGGSGTDFSLRLPDGAECPGDSAFEDWRINGYMVPAAVDVATLTYDGLGPAPAALQDYDTFRQPLYDTDTNPYASAMTAAVEKRGDPGVIADIPMFTFSVYPPGDVPAGRYHVGIACTLLNEVGRVWDAEIVIAEAADDHPSQLHWEVMGAAPGGSASELPPPLVVLAAAAAIAAIVTATRRRRASSPVPVSREGAP
jgi:hypothetical protein